MAQVSEKEVERVPSRFHSNQDELFFRHRDKRFKTVPKGRRWGFTRGALQYAIQRMQGATGKLAEECPEYIRPVTRVLWGDTINSNIDRYVSRYAMPILRKLPRANWHWSKRDKELRILNSAGGWSLMDFRSADRPENWEGFGYGLVILNEAGIILKDIYLWENAVLPMIMDYQAEMIVGGTPKGKKDKKRHAARGNEYSIFYELAQKGTEGAPTQDPRYITLTYTSYDNPMIKKEEIDMLAGDLPAVVRDQEIFGRFVEEQLGGIFLKEWWQFYDARTLPPRDKFLKIILSLDTAFKDREVNDFSVATIWGMTETGYYLLDMWRGRALYPDLKRAIISLAGSWRVDWVVIEDKGSGTDLAAEMERDTRLHIKRIQVDKDKVSRATANTPMIESGNVWIPDPLWQPWVRDFIEEHCEFPQGEYDDIVDSTSQGLSFLKNVPTKEPTVRFL